MFLRSHPPLLIIALLASVQILPDRSLIGTVVTSGTYLIPHLDCALGKLIQLHAIKGSPIFDALML